MINWATVATVAVAAPLAYVLGSIWGTLRGVHRELVRIRLATVSLHDRVVPEFLVRSVRSHACDCGGAYCPDRSD